MANIHILASPASDAGTYSGGSWSASLPLANVLTQQPKQVARSTDAALASTRFRIDLGTPKPVSVCALVNHNCSTAGTLRFRVSNAADGSSPLADVTRTARRANVAWGSQPWGSFPWAGYASDVEPGGSIALIVLPAPVVGQHLLVDIADAANPDGAVQIGRVMIGLPLVPRINMGFGAALGLTDESKSSRSAGGQTWFEKRPQRRTFRASLEALSESEAYGAVYDFQRRVGLTGNLLAIYDPGDADDIGARRTIYGVLASLADIVTANASTDAPYTWQFAIEELL